jgi:hypothetical protein
MFGLVVRIQALHRVAGGILDDTHETTEQRRSLKASTDSAIESLQYAQVSIQLIFNSKQVKLLNIPPPPTPPPFERRYKG